MSRHENAGDGRTARSRSDTVGQRPGPRRSAPIAASEDASSPGRRRLRREPLARPRRGRSTLSASTSDPRLFTATIAYADGGVMIQAFHASVAHHPMQVVQRLRDRFGDDVLPFAELREGFHPASPIVVSIVPPPICDMIRATERGCLRPTALSFAVDIEQRVEI